MAKKVWEEKVKSKKSAAVKPKASKTKPQKTAPAKKTVTAKKALPTKKAVTVKKKTVAKAKVPEKAAKKAIPAKKVAPKKTIPPKKTVISKKVASAKKAVVAKKAVAKGKPKAKAVKAGKKSVTVRKMVQVKKTVAQKKKVTPKKPVAVKKAAPTKIVSKLPTPVKKTIELKTNVKEKEVKGMEVIVPRGNKEAEKISALRGKELKAILLKRREDLIKEILESRVRESDPLKRDIGDIYDEASTERERELSLILGDRDRQKLIEIDDALQRMESGEYGVCENCGDRIAPARLKAQPFTKLCINCKAEEERQEARQRKFEIEGVYKNISQPEEEEG